MLVWSNPATLDSAGIQVDWAGFGWNRGATQPAKAFDRREDVFGPCAGAALYRREMLDEIGLFDEDFYTYYEDVDLAWRARRAGWRCMYVPTARVLHFQSAMGKKIGSRKVFLLTRNRWWTTLKNIDSRDLWWSLFLVILYDAISLFFQTLRVRSFAPILARLQAAVGAKKMLTKRGRSAKRIKLSRTAPFS
jgi:GT2 family glycosyltransferase